MSRLLTAVLAMVTVLGVLAVSPAAAQETGERSWLAMGDSYSSGEGIPGTTPADRDGPGGGPNTQGRDCRRATGRDTDATAWAVGAYDEVEEELGLAHLDFVACTGAIIDQAHDQVGEATAATGRQRWDLVTFSFGGNDIGFGDVLYGCLDIARGGWAQFDLSPGCDISERRLRRRVDMLSGRIAIEAGEYQGSTSLRSLLALLAANQVTPGGDVVVVGYPQLIEETGRWPRWRQVTGMCERVFGFNVGMLRSVTGYLNEQIARVVQEADRRSWDRGVRFHFLDISRDPYEYSDNPRDRHGLCAEDPWLNGLTASVTDGDFRLGNSFHPEQFGHTNTARVLAAYLRANVNFDDVPDLVGPAIDSLGCVGECEVTGTVEFEHPSWGSSTLVTLGPVPGTFDYAMYVIDAFGDIVWDHEFGSPWYKLEPNAPVTDSTGHLFIDFDPGRYNGIIVLKPIAGGFEDFDTLPPYGEYNTRFYYADAVDSDGDGVLDIEVSENDCDPSCAGGSVTSVTYRWDGTDYRAG